MTIPVYIYGLIDPITDQLRYVGRTVDIKQRAREHRNIKQTVRTNPHLTNWIRALADRNAKSELFVIDEVDDSTWQEAERFWIGYFRYIGCNLINMSDGGEGALGHRINIESMKKVWAAAALANKGKKKGPLSEDTKRKLSESVKRYYSIHGRSENNRKAISLAMKGKPKSQEHIAKVSAALRGKSFHTDTQKQQAREMMLSKPSPALRLDVQEKIRQKAIAQWVRWREINGGKRVPLGNRVNDEH